MEVLADQGVVPQRINHSSACIISTSAGEMMQSVAFRPVLGGPREETSNKQRCSTWSRRTRCPKIGKTSKSVAKRGRDPFKADQSRTNCRRGV